MLISKKKRDSEEFKRLFCTKPMDAPLSRGEIKNILLNACTKANETKEIEFDEDSEIFSNVEDITDEEVAEYIVENPDEVIVNFPIISNVKMEEKLPFFRSIMYKLAN